MQVYTTRALKIQQPLTPNPHRNNPQVATPAILKKDRAAPSRASPFDDGK